MKLEKAKLCRAACDTLGDIGGSMKMGLSLFFMAVTNLLSISSFAAPIRSFQPLSGTVVSSGRGIRNVWVKGEICGAEKSSCDAMIVDSVTVKIGGNLQTFENVIFSHPQITSCSMEDAGIAAVMLMNGLSPREEWSQETQNQILNLTVSSISLAPVRLENLSHFHKNLSGQGYMARMSIQMEFKAPVTVDRAEESLCDPEVKGKMELRSKLFLYGEKTDLSNLDFFNR